MSTEADLARVERKMDALRAALTELLDRLPGRLVEPGLDPYPVMDRRIDSAQVKIARIEQRLLLLDEKLEAIGALVNGIIAGLADRPDPAPRLDAHEHIHNIINRRLLAIEARIASLDATAPSSRSERNPGLSTPASE